MIDKATKNGREILPVRVCAPSLGAGTLCIEQTARVLAQSKRSHAYVEQAPTGHPSASVAVADR